ncbi:ABC transporter permease [Adlercreutzia sp. R21]|uniref:ABC transporter permease n=1 Tax=Adlercreutzia wanghongyangiae TaxID=3111451 RepID=UPI002DC0096A|nr:ABC transporter permease [Adlercreutzia sp. R21]MEC4184688.1 ABC transporter permease [Adlercreutzia sp. R21]
MNAMANFTVKSLRANRVRTLVTIAGVALAAALLTAVLTTYASLNDFLYRMEAEQSGTWMACVEAPGGAATQERIDAAAADPSVAAVATLRDVGFGRLTPEQQNVLGAYVPVRTGAGDLSAICGIRPSEGRLPENENEVMLFATWQSYENLELGDEITLDVGRRVARLAPGEEGEQVHGEKELGWGVNDGEGVESVIEDGTPLDSSMGVFDAAADGGKFNEELVDAEKRTFTVVGFYDRAGYALSTGAGMTALIGPGAAGADAFTDVYLTLNDVASAQDVSAQAEALFPDDHIVLHTSMLRYMGISDGASLWSTFYGIVAVLAGVIVVACVSLIFNAFNISVAERIKQFGLLSSVGASRRQLRRAVVLEGALVALVGIPLGLLIGLGGCAVTFAFIGPMIATLSGAEDVPFTLAVNGVVLALAAALTFVTVLVSVWIPAKRAGRTNIIDSLRAQGATRVSKRGAKAAARAAAGGRLWRSRGVSGRLFGIGGTLARINRKRGTGKGRAASVSLALAIVLLMTAGSLNVFLGTLADVVSGGAEAAGQVSVTTQLMAVTPGEADGVAEGSAGEGAVEGDDGTAADGTAADGATAETSDAEGAAADGAAVSAEDAAAAPGAEGAATGAAGAEGAAAGVDAMADDDAAPTTPEALLAEDNARLADEAAVFAEAFDALGALPNASAVGWKLSGDANVVLPASMVGEAFMSEDGLAGGVMADGRYGTVASLVYLDDASFDAYAREAGLNPADFRDPAHLRAIALGQGYGNNGSLYQLLDVLREPGTVDVIAAATYQGKPVAGIGMSAELGADGTPQFAFVPYAPMGSDDTLSSLTMADVEVQTVSLEVAAVVDETPPVVGGPGAGLQLIVPMSVAAYQGFGNTDPVFYSYFDPTDGDHAALAEELSSAGGEYFHDVEGYEPTFYSYNDFIAEQDSTQMLAMVVNVFCLLFTVILALIAMANVFNTVTNSLILRRREFAVMRSVGLSNRQFRRMIAEECMSFGIGGLVPGLLISALVAWLLWAVVTQSMSGLGFTLPWGYVALAVGLTAAAMGISVAYGMHRCRADSVVEALRADAV